jgi:hypothetical protein
MTSLLARKGVPGENGRMAGFPGQGGPLPGVSTGIPDYNGNQNRTMLSGGKGGTSNVENDPQPGCNGYALISW